MKTNEPMETQADITAPSLDVSYESCLCERTPDPCTLVILGASGDLTARKLVPAVFELFSMGALPQPFRIVGCSRTELSADQFRHKMKRGLSTQTEQDPNEWDTFSGILDYVTVSYDDPESFANLREHLRKLDRTQGTAGNYIFYLAIPPTLYKQTAAMLGEAGLAKEETGWSRLVVEKPFGRDLESAVELDRSLHEHWGENQIFRIDHYLAKETVQNILMLRFANAIFEPIWNRRYIDHVSIIATESLGVEHRAGYYEQAGVLRDMFQNHMMQLLSLTALEPPSLFEADVVRDEKTKTYRALRPFPVDNLQEHLILGQYGSGTLEGRTVPGYREEPGVNPRSLTPTFAMMKVFLDNWRWQGVPFYLTSGKRMARKITGITIRFKEVPHSMFRSVIGSDIRANRLTLGIYPDEKISLVFQTKYPGAQVRLRSVTMDFNYHYNYEGPVLDSYGKVLLDCMLGDQMLFWRQDGVELCWGFLTPILAECEACAGREQMLHSYKSGSWGPQAAQTLIQEVVRAFDDGNHG